MILLSVCYFVFLTRTHLICQIDFILPERVCLPSPLYTRRSLCAIINRKFFEVGTWFVSSNQRLKLECPTALWRRRKNRTPRVRFETYSKGQDVYGKYFRLLAYIKFISSSVGRCAWGIFYYLGFVSHISVYLRSWVYIDHFIGNF